MNIPPDDNNLPPPILDPAYSQSMGDVSLTKKGSKVPLIVVGLLIVGGGGYLAYSAKKTHAERTDHARFMEEFRNYETEDLGKYWACMLGPGTIGTNVNTPNAITQKIDQQFASDFRNYPTKVREECGQKAKDAADKANALQMLPQYTSAVAEYGKSIMAMQSALEDWSKVAPEQIQTKMVAKNLEEYGDAWHAFSGGAPTPEVIAYDQFLHCAVPDVDTKYKDDIELGKYIYETCKKDPAYGDKLQEECGKLITGKPAAPTKAWKATQAKFGSGEAEGKSLLSCLKKSRKGKMKDNLSPVGEQWIKFREAREVVLKIGADALKE